MGPEAGRAPPLFRGCSGVWRDAKREEFPLDSEFGLPSPLPLTDPLSEVAVAATDTSGLQTEEGGGGSARRGN